MPARAKHAISKVLIKGKLIIVYDDIRTNVGMLGGIAEKVTPYAVNQMIRIGKGLVYVCITEEKAIQLQLPLMTSPNNDFDKTFTVSVDHLNTTTGISAFERSHTIESFTLSQTASSDLRRPGHIFPIVAKRQGLLERIGIAEALMQLCREASALPVAYACEVLDSDGEIANRSQIEQLAKNHQIPIINMSELLATTGQTIASFDGVVIEGRQLGGRIGFPTANLKIEETPNMGQGVYGVTVTYNNRKYFGVMNRGTRPTFKNSLDEVHTEVHLLDFDQMIYGKRLKVDVNFFIRQELAFLSVDELIIQLKKDVDSAYRRFHTDFAVRFVQEKH